MKLSPQQQQAFDLILAWMKTDEKRFVLAGYAGAGKTTVAREIGDAVGMDLTAFLAYTGKAANVLREKGCGWCSTIHGAIYHLVDDIKGEPVFALDTEADIKGCRLVIVDEYSMLPKKVREDLESLAAKVLYLGDPFQLPPVQGECDLKPDFFITEIHRQALESNIIRYATDVREGRALSFCRHDDFDYLPQLDTTPEMFEKADQLIVGYNATRTAWNKQFRNKLGFTSQYPMVGDKLICTKNNHKMALFNGLIGYAKNDTKSHPGERIKLNFETWNGLEVWDGNFRGLTTNQEKPFMHLDRFDFAYAITAHKSQGSEWENVVVYEQPIGRDAVERRRWLYTSLTRARQKVTLVKPIER